MAYVNPVYHGGKNVPEQITDEFLGCPICFLPGYKQPKLLPCGHTFCLPCLKSYAGPRGEPAVGTTCCPTRRCFACPTCGLETKVPARGVEGFPTNLFVDRQLDMLLRRHNRHRGRDDTWYNISCYGSGWQGTRFLCGQLDPPPHLQG